MRSIAWLRVAGLISVAALGACTGSPQVPSTAPRAGPTSASTAPTQAPPPAATVAAANATPAETNLIVSYSAVSYTHLTLPTIYTV